MLSGNSDSAVKTEGAKPVLGDESNIIGQFADPYMVSLTSEPDTLEVTTAEMFAMVEQVTDWFASSHE